MSITITWQGLDGQERLVQLDAYESESHEDTATITDHPVEAGVVITDHVRDNPSSVSLSGTVSNIPMPGKPGVTSGPIDLSVEYQAPSPATRTIELQVASPPITPSVGGLIRAGIGAIASAVLGAPKATVWGEDKRRRESARATVLRYGSPQSRPQAVDLLLLEAKALKAPITVTTPLRTVTNLQITRLAPSREVQSGTAVLFQLDLRAIRTVNSETVDAPVPAEARGASKKNAGSQNAKTKDDTPEQARKRRRTLAAYAADEF
jgi:hypothetical protein